MGKEIEYPTPQELDGAIETFFTMEHNEGGKQVSASELLTMRTETIGESRGHSHSIGQRRPSRWLSA